jgi:hypothetical protein
MQTLKLPEFQFKELSYTENTGEYFLVDNVLYPSEDRRFTKTQNRSEIHKITRKIIDFEIETKYYYMDGGERVPYN